VRVAIWTGININWSKLVPVGCSWPTISRETLRLARAYARVFMNFAARCDATQRVTVRGDAPQRPVR
jgi:hypothetical protein